MCQIFQIQTNFSIKPNAQIACSVCYRAVVLSKLQLSHKAFTLQLVKSNFHVSAFLLVIFGLLFSIIHFLIFALNFSSFCWQISIFTLLFFRSNFQVSAGKFQLSGFSFSSVYCQIPTFRLLLAIPIFTFLLCKFFASYKLHFQIGITCVISAQLPYNVLALQAVWD